MRPSGWCSGAPVLWCSGALVLRCFGDVGCDVGAAGDVGGGLCACDSGGVERDRGAEEEEATPASN
jgi:hypothetical protein